jgi:tetratricopeptide (TPR) repeat protein
MSKEKVIFIVIGAIIVVGMLIFYQVTRKDVETAHVHDTIPGGEDPAIAAMIARFRENPEDLEVMKDLGNYYYDTGNYSMAEMFYKRVLELDPHDINVLVDLGTALFNNNRGDEAIGCYQDALLMDPEHKNANFNLGVVKDAMGDREGAIAAWRRFIEIAGDDDPHVPPLKKIIEEMEAEDEEGGNLP